MATAREHMQADMEWLLAQEGEEADDHLIDGQVYRAIVQDLGTDPGPFEGSARRQINVFLLKGALPKLPRPDSRLTVDGIDYLVDAVDPTGPLDILTLGQYS